MRGGVVIVLLGLTAFGSYSIGRKDARTANVPSATAIQAPHAVSRQLALTEVPDNPASPLSTVLTATPAKSPQQGAPKQSDTERNVEIALTAAAVAAILIKASRDQYHSTGRPCAI
jgi:hypothetical protein